MPKPTQPAKKKMPLTTLRSKVPVLRVPVVEPWERIVSVDLGGDEDFHEFLYKEANRAISDAHDAGQNAATLVEIHGKLQYWVIQRTDWIPVLEKSLTHFETREAYEKCATVRNLIGSIRYAAA